MDEQTARISDLARQCRLLRYVVSVMMGIFLIAIFFMLMYQGVS